jgi:hypothetical protein
VSNGRGFENQKLRSGFTANGADVHFIIGRAVLAVSSCFRGDRAVARVDKMKLHELEAKRKARGGSTTPRLSAQNGAIVKDHMQRVSNPWKHKIKNILIKVFK